MLTLRLQSRLGPAQAGPWRARARPASALNRTGGRGEERKEGLFQNIALSSTTLLLFQPYSSLATVPDFFSVETSELPQTCARQEESLVSHNLPSSILPPPLSFFMLILAPFFYTTATVTAPPFLSPGATSSSSSSCFSSASPISAAVLFRLGPTVENDGGDGDGGGGEGEARF